MKPSPSQRPLAHGDGADLSSGLIFVALGSCFLWQGTGFRFGTLSAMGPGFLPCLVAGCLLVLGAAITLRGALARRAPIGDFGWRPLCIVLAGIILFALLIERAGLFPSSALSVLLVTYAGDTRPFLQRGAFALALAAGACAIFIGLIGLPVPVIVRPW